MLHSIKKCTSDSIELGQTGQNRSCLGRFFYLPVSMLRLRFDSLSLVTDCLIDAFLIFLKFHRSVV